MPSFESQMIEPVCELMQRELKIDVAMQEFSAGYGYADIVGAKLCTTSCRKRERMGLALPLDQVHIIRVLLSLRSNRRTSLSYLLSRISISEATLRKKILPDMVRLGLIEKDEEYVRLRAFPPNPTKGVIAVEAKQTKWREAILQARRYTFFAEQTYIAVWYDTALRIDKHLLYRHRIGLIAVDVDYAEILIPAPIRTPREKGMHRLCSEVLYGKALSFESVISKNC